MSSSPSTPFPMPLGDNTHYDLNSTIMLASIVCFSAVIFLVISLHVYARCMITRHGRRRAINQLNGLPVTVNAGDPPRTGLDPLIIASLPTFVFKQSDSGQAQASSSSSIECAVCLSALENEELARLLPNCKHTFHQECIDKWFSSRSTCPVCRTEANPQLQPEPREAPVAGAAFGPTLELVNSTLELGGGTSNGGEQSQTASSKVNNGGSISRLSSFKRMLSRERSSRRIQSDGQEDGTRDIETQ